MSFKVNKDFNYNTQKITERLVLPPLNSSQPITNSLITFDKTNNKVYFSSNNQWIYLVYEI
jgi:hypothetical protein